MPPPTLVQTKTEKMLEGDSVIVMCVACVLDGWTPNSFEGRLHPWSYMPSPTSS